jgi:hypothetical protein
MRRLAIVGAGMAGLAAGRHLRMALPELALTIFEKSRGLGGRAATRRRAGCVFDHGAQLFKTPSESLLRLVRDELPTEGLLPIAGPVWTFDAAGRIAEGDAQIKAEPQWTYADGISRLGKLLAAGLEVRTEARVARLEQPGGFFRLLGPLGQELGAAEHVLLTAPAPQCAEIVQHSTLDPALRDLLLGELAQARYRRCISLALAYERPVERPFYALVNHDRVHPISWLAREHAKGATRCPQGQALLIAQMAAHWSLEHWDEAPEVLADEAARLVSELLGEELGAPGWFDVQRWRYALPDTGCDFEALNTTGSGLFFAGDFTAGQGRVHLAIQQGWQVAERIAARM